MRNSPEDPIRNPSFFGPPRTPIGWWSVGLAAAFIVLFGAWWRYLGQATTPRPEFFSDPVLAWLLIAAAAAGCSAAIAGMLALVSKRERSWLILICVLLGSVVWYGTIGSLMGLNR